MNATWIMTANAGHAHFYAMTDSNQSLQEINSLANPAASAQTVDTETDRLGQRSASKSIHSVGQPTQPSGYEQNQTPAEHQTELFARSVAAFLLRSHQQDLFKRLVLTASPEFLGTLRPLLDPSVQSAVATEIAKDYTHFRGKELVDLVNSRRDAA